MQSYITSPKKNIAILLAGLITLTFTVILAISLFTFDIDDPSFNSFTDKEPTNFFGSFGSHSADLLMQLFGLGSYFIILIPFIWAIQNICQYDGYKFFIKFTSYLACVTTFLALLSSLATAKEWIFASYGGAVGNLLYVYTLNLQVDYILYIQISLFIFFLYFALGFKLDLWKAATILLLKYVWNIIIKSFQIIKGLFNGASKLKNMLSRSEPLETTPAFLAEDTDPIDYTDQEPPKVITPRQNSTPLQKDSSFKTSGASNQFELPSADLLNKINLSANKKTHSKKILEQNSETLASILNDFGVKGEIIGVYPGPVVTLYELEPSAGTKSSRIIGLADDIARTMCANSARISVIPGKNSIGIELPNESREVVYLRELIENENYAHTQKKLPIILGKDISGGSITADLASMPHLLVAGTTGSGKSVAINTMILSLLYKLTPEGCTFIMIDPKMLELSVYDGIPHLLAPVVTEPNKAVTSLKWVVREMENRYRLMSHLGVRNIQGYNQKIKDAVENNITLERKVQTGFDPETGKPSYENVEIDKKPLPFIVVIVDEMADLMIVAGKEIEGSIQRLAQMARAAGIHIIMATQRPSVDVITGVIKANFPTRISFHVTSKVDSRTILGEMGAEQLLGKGDMLYMSGGSKIKRVHGPFVDDKEVEKVVSFLKKQSSPDYSIDITEDDDTSIISTASTDELDELYQQAVELVKREQKASTSYLQRYFKIGYNRAATIIEQLEKNNIVGAANHVGKREVLVSNEK